MEIVLEHSEVETLLREALKARKIEVPNEADFCFRSNHKKGTVRVVFKSREEK